MPRICLHALGSSGRSIVLQTHGGNDIPNQIGLEPEPRHLAKYKAIFDRHKIGWVERKPPSGVYNCVGHVWACRRTSVFDDLERHLRTIFDDDKYRLVSWPDERLFVGDLVTYWVSVGDNKTFLHVGIVVELRKIIEGSTELPWILSKWDDTSGEVLHHYQDHPLPEGAKAEFWTDRIIPEA